MSYFKFLLEIPWRFIREFYQKSKCKEKLLNWRIFIRDSYYRSPSDASEYHTRTFLRLFSRILKFFLCSSRSSFRSLLLIPFLVSFKSYYRISPGVPSGILQGVSSHVSCNRIPAGVHFDIFSTGISFWNFDFEYFPKDFTEFYLYLSLESGSPGYLRKSAFCKYFKSSLIFLLHPVGSSPLT